MNAAEVPAPLLPYTGENYVECGEYLKGFCRFGFRPWPSTVASGPPTPDAAP